MSRHGGGGTRVHLGNLPDEADQRDVESFFKGYGRVSQILLKNGYAFIEFDHHRDASDAIHDLDNSELIPGRKISLAHAKPSGSSIRNGGGYGRGGGGRFGGGGGYGGGGYGGGGYGGRGGGRYNDDYRSFDRDRFARRAKFGVPERTNHRLMVENLSSRVSWQDLKDLFRREGECTYANRDLDNRSGTVDFRSKGDLNAVFDKFQDYELHGRKMKLTIESVSRSASRSRSRSRSRSPRDRSRSRSRSVSPPPRRRSRTRSRSNDKEEEEDGGNKDD